MKTPKYLLPAAILVTVVLLSYFPVFNAGFTNYDDNVLVTENSLIRDVSSANIKKIFFAPYRGLYHPLVLLSYAAEHRLFGYNPKIFHATNLVLHTASTLLVLRLVLLLGGGPAAALVGALLFGAHPVHVESVAWIAERKDALYGFFFLASLAAYLRYLNGNAGRWLALSFAFFAMSLLSKPMAVTLPFVMFLADWYKNRKFTKVTIAEKLPFLVLTIVFAGAAVAWHYSSGDASAAPGLSPAHFFSQAVNGPLFYLSKIFAPIDLSCFYPYGPGDWGEYFAFQPAVYFTAGLLAAGLFYSVKFGKTVAFGSLFFIITLLPALQLLPFGQLVPADRYMYIPSLGIFFVAAAGFETLWKKLKFSARFAAGSAIAAVIVTLIALSNARCGVWRDSFTLWNDAIKKHPHSAFAYKNRADAWKDEGRVQEALADYARSIELNSSYAEAYNNRGNLYSFLRDYPSAVKDYSHAIQANPGYLTAIYNRAIAFAAQERYSEALLDYSLALEIDPVYTGALNNRGIIFARTGAYEKAIADFTVIVALAPAFTEAYANRALAYFKAGRFAECAGDVKLLQKRGYPVNPGLLKALIDKGPA